MASERGTGLASRWVAVLTCLQWFVGTLIDRCKSCGPRLLPQDHFLEQWHQKVGGPVAALACFMLRCRWSLSHHVYLLAWPPAHSCTPTPHPRTWRSARPTLPSCAGKHGVQTSCLCGVDIHVHSGGLRGSAAVQTRKWMGKPWGPNQLHVCASAAATWMTSGGWPGSAASSPGRRWHRWTTPSQVGGLEGTGLLTRQQGSINQSSPGSTQYKSEWLCLVFCRPPIPPASADPGHGGVPVVSEHRLPVPWPRACPCGPVDVPKPCR